MADSIGDQLMERVRGIRSIANRIQAIADYRKAAGFQISEEYSANPPQLLEVEDRRVKAIALYLPQFHRIPENDEWWGTGFTEWTNVKRGRPIFDGHYQPHVPHQELGYYDLDDPDVLNRQAAIAKRYGLYGFCFYYYWFGGRKVLEKPIERLLKNGSPGFPFAICWANENWTRTWDGLNKDILLEQKEVPGSYERFFYEIIPLLKDHRYIRVGDRPLVIVYRPEKLCSAARAAKVWRAIALREGVGDPYLVSVHSFRRDDPRLFGFDAAMQFPPLLINAKNLARRYLHPAGIHFSGRIYDYREAMKISLGWPSQPYPLFRSVMPSWDNTARRLDNATIWVDSSPQLYYQWLRGAVARTVDDQPRERRFIFINAWNEWAEGAHLEPDSRYGYEYLEQTARALAI